MRIVRPLIILVAIILGFGSAHVLAAQCTEVFGDADGVNGNLGSEGLDLSGVPWAEGGWPPSGTPQSGGERYVSGSSIGNYELELSPGAELVIFVNGNLTVGRGTLLNAGESSQNLLIVVRGNVTIAGGNNSQGNQVVINGSIYAGGAISVGNNVFVNGALAAAGPISEGNRDVSFSEGDVNQELLEGLCDADIVLSANGQSQGPVIVEVGSTVDFSVVASGCPSPQTSFFNADWVDQWRVDGSVRDQQGSNQSPCSRVPDWSTTFDDPGVYTVEFEAFFCADTVFGFCAQYQFWSSDEVVIEVVDESTALNCETQDDFSANVLNPELWVTSRSSGSFTPGIDDGRLRMTEAVPNQATAATLQAEIPGADNLVVLTFDYYAYGGTGADGVAFVLSDANFTPQPGSYGGSLGYAQRRGSGVEGPGFSGGWLGIGLDEYGNFANASEGRVGGAGFTPQSVTLRGSGSGLEGYKFLANSGGLTPEVDGTGANNPHRYEITIDSRTANQAIVTVRRDTGAGLQTLIGPVDVLTDPDQAAVPETFLLSLTGSTGGSTNVHELDNVGLCALRINPVGEQVDHFEIIHDGVALTCQPETLQVRACANADCSTLFTDPVEATLAPANGWQGGNRVTLTNGFGEATLQNTMPGEVTLDVIGSTPSTRPQAVTLCQVGGSLSAGNCQLPFFESGLAFDIPELISHRPSGPVRVQAVRQDDVTQQCVPAFENQTKTVEFWSDYVDPGPAGRAVSRPVSVNGQAIGNGASAPTGLELAFGEDGIAEMEVTYPDAGLVQVTARYVGSEATEDAGLVMPGADEFVSIPAGFCVASAGNCAAGDASCPAFVRAGEAFDLSITAAGWQSDADMDFCAGNPGTPNFRLADIPLQVELAAPVGGETGTVSPARYSHERASDAASVVSAQQSEVGVFRFVTEPPAGAYLGRNLPKGKSAPIGRFYPDRFRINVDPGEFAPVCEPGSFTYTGQPFDWLMPPSALIEPLSVQGLRTRNYTAAGFQRLAVTGINRSVPAGDETAVDAGNGSMAVTVGQQPGTLTTIAPGLMQFTYSTDDAFSYIKTPATRIDPFVPELQFALESVRDTDGVQAESAPYRFTPGAAFDVRYGRLVMENVYGPETVGELQMPFRMEFFRAGSFEVNLDDSCSGWSTAAIDNTGNHHTLAASSGTISAGTAGPLRLAPNGSQGTDTLVWQVSQWLQDDRDGDGALEFPSATATFGVYRGHDRVIYWREVP